MAKSKVNYEYAKLKGVTNIEVADPTNRLKKGARVSSGAEVYKSTDGKLIQIKIKPAVERLEPLPHTYDGPLSGIYVAPKRDGGITCNFYVSIEKLEEAGEKTTAEEAANAVHEIFRLISLKKEGKLQDEINNLIANMNLTPAA